ncbi:MAG TPA: archaetidylserine decarboxylase [Steroidobacteraceae bacterium]
MGQPDSFTNARAAGAIAPPSLRDRLFVAMQHVLPQHFLSRLVLRLARVRLRPVKNLLIRNFVRSFRPNMSEAAQPNPLLYPSFNAFFTRSLSHGARPIDIDPTVLTCPVDGTISQIGRLDGSRILQAKGHDYTLESLFDGSPEWAERFTGGTFATLYLAPYNYHRIHMPLAGTLRAAWYVPGSLFSVNAVTASAVSGLFAKNERVVCVFETGQPGQAEQGAPRAFAMVLVGALFVGSIATVWHGDVTPRSPRRRVDLAVDASRAPLRLAKGAEMGRFNMGSTVILLSQPDMIDWLPKFVPGTKIEVGRMLARLR